MSTARDVEKFFDNVGTYDGAAIDDKFGWFTIKNIVSATECHPSTVRAVINGLVRLGVVDKTRVARKNFYRKTHTWASPHRRIFVK